MVITSTVISAYAPGKQKEIKTVSVWHTLNWLNGRCRVGEIVFTGTVGMEQAGNKLGDEKCWNKLGDEKWRSTYHFFENSGHFVLKTDLLLAVISNFERKVALENLTFFWVKCLTQIRYMILIHWMTINWLTWFGKWFVTTNTCVMSLNG